MTLEAIITTLVINNVIILGIGALAFRIKLEGRLVRLETWMKMLLTKFNIDFEENT